ncbi:MAG: RNB domain-containing ribonuclease, partial [bacterium]
VVKDEKGFEVDAAPRSGLLAFPGDRVRVEVGTPAWAHRRRHGPGRRALEAVIVAVLERGTQSLLGRYHASHKRAWVTPKDPGVVPALDVALRADVPEGAMVAVDIGPHPGVVTGEIVHVWPDADAPRAVIEQLVYERDLPREFPAPVLEEAARCPDDIPSEERARRLDLRDLEVVVIDPADARDHDDAVSWEPRREGGGRLGVHIADVSWYVRPGSLLDAEARARGVSVYLTDRVLPMLPPRLSADLCSLLKGKDRLARTIFLELGADGAVEGGEMRETVIRPTVSLSYEDAWTAMQDAGSRLPHAQTLHAMDALARTLRRRRFEGGSLDFQFPETKVILDAAGEPERIEQRMGDPSH